MEQSPGIAQIIKHWLALLLGMTATGLLCAAAGQYVHSPRGAIGPTIFQAESPLIAILATTLVMALAFFVSVVVGRIINSAVGLFVMGWGIAVLAMRTETIQEIALVGNPSLWWITIETLFWALCLLIISWLMFRFAGKLDDIKPAEYEQEPHPLTSSMALKSALFGAVILPGIYLIAQTPMKGQVLVAVIIGSMFAGLLSRLSMAHVQPILLFATPCVFAALGQAFSIWQMKQPLDETFVQHAIPNLLLPLPIDFAAGSLMGVALGLGWAKSFLHQEEDDQQPQPAST